MDGQELIKSEAEKRLLELDLSNNKSQPAMLSIAADLGLEHEGNSADILRDVLTPVKESLIAGSDEKGPEVDEAAAKKLEDEAAAKKLEDEAAAKKLEDEAAEKLAKSIKGDFIMATGHLSWGLNNKSHFYADTKPLINAKVMGKYAPTLATWLKAGWIVKGSYKK